MALCKPSVFIVCMKHTKIKRFVLPDQTPPGTETYVFELSFPVFQIITNDKMSNQEIGNMFILEKDINEIKEEEYLEEFYYSIKEQLILRLKEEERVLLILYTLAEVGEGISRVLNVADSHGILPHYLVGLNLSTGNEFNHQLFSMSCYLDPEGNFKYCIDSMTSELEKLDQLKAVT